MSICPNLSGPSGRCDPLRRLLAGAAFSSALFVGGCSPPKEPPVPTFPVTGTVKDARGTLVTRGSLAFRSLTSPGSHALGELKEDGTYALATMHDGQRLVGAVAGEHEVTYLPISDDQSEPPMVLPKPVRVEERENELPIVLPKRTGK